MEKSARGTGGPRSGGCGTTEPGLLAGPAQVDPMGAATAGCTPPCDESETDGTAIGRIAVRWMQSCLHA